MSDIINKILSLLVIFIICIICPLSYTYMSSEKQAEREVLNKAKYTLDKFVEKEVLTDTDLDTMYMELNEYGLTVDSKIIKYTLTNSGEYVIGDEATAYDEMIYETNGKTSGTYLSRYNCKDYDSLKRVASDKYKYILESEDIVKIDVKGVVKTRGSRFIEKVTGVHSKNINFSLASIVR